MINYTPPTKHNLLFYNSPEDYLDIILPYLKAGLENNEFCVWIPPATLKVEDAQMHLGQSLEDLDGYFKKEQLSINGYESFYLKDEVFSADKVIESFAQLEKTVLDKGFKGIRVTGDGSWALADKHWFSLLSYENQINRFIEAYKIRAICSYLITKLELKSIYKLGASHQSTLVKQEQDWKRLDSSIFTESRYLI